MKDISNELEILGCSSLDNLEQINKKYQQKLNLLQIQINNAPNQDLKSIYESNLKELNSAMQLVQIEYGKQLPSKAPVEFKSESILNQEKNIAPSSRMPSTSFWSNSNKLLFLLVTLLSTVCIYMSFNYLTYKKNSSHFHEWDPLIQNYDIIVENNTGKDIEIGFLDLFKFNPDRNEIIRDTMSVNIKIPFRKTENISKLKRSNLTDAEVGGTACVGILYWYDDLITRYYSGITYKKEIGTNKSASQKMQRVIVISNF